MADAFKASIATLVVLATGLMRFNAWQYTNARDATVAIAAFEMFVALIPQRTARLYALVVGTTDVFATAIFVFEALNS